MRILVVEDDAQLADLIVRCLADGGFDADVARDGHDAVWRATEGTYDAMTLDVMLPGLNGYVVCRQLRAAGVTLPILLLTAKVGEYDEAEAFEHGADDYLRKPFSPVVLVARLQRLILRVGMNGATTAADELCAGDIQLRRRAHSCAYAGRAVELTTREFAVLEALALRSPDVVSKAELLDVVWGMDFVGDPNIIEVYIGYLRRKLGVHQGNRPIETVRGVGYRLS